jgi:hypothetical protein
MKKGNIKKVELSRGEGIYDKTLTSCLIGSRIKITKKKKNSKKSKDTNISSSTTPMKS